MSSILFNSSTTKIVLLTIHKLSGKIYNYLTSYQNLSISIDKFYYGIYANA